MTAPVAKPWSLRRRLTGRVLALVTLGWLATIALAALVLDHELNEMFDEELQALAQTTVLFLDASGTAAIPREIGVETNDGDRILRILSDTAPEPPAPWPALDRDGFADVAGWRVLRVSAEGAVIEVAHALSWRREEMLETASSFLLLILPLIGLVVWALGRGLTQGLAPVETLAHEMDQRTPDDLSPLATQGLPLELQPMVAGMNGYVARVDALRRSERQFVGNAAHELRTPVAAIRARLDLSDDPEARAAVPMLDALTRRVDRLLQLARSEAGLGLGQGPADLVQVLRLLIDDVRRDAPFAIRFDDSDLDRLMVAVDVDALAILIRNALENAIQHGTGPVQVLLTPDAVLTLRNPTPLTAFHDAPFHKSAGSQGAGLGLSIMAGLARSMGVRLEKTIRDGQASVTIRFARPA
jgi:two-component system OmpR family sensor kinase